MSTIGNRVTLPVWTSVNASNSSSSVPKPPGKTTNPCAYLTNIVLRAKKYRKLMPRSTYSLMPCSNGSSMPRPTETPPRLDGTLVGRLHDARAAAGDHRVSGPSECRAERNRRLVDADRRAGSGRMPKTLIAGPRFGQRPEALDELGLDPHDPPRVGVHPVGGTTAVQQSLVGRGHVDLGAAQRHRPAVLLGGPGGVLRCRHGRQASHDPRPVPRRARSAYGPRRVAPRAGRRVRRRHGRGWGRQARS